VARFGVQKLQDQPRPAARRTTAPAAGALSAPVLALQRMAGNRAVSRLLARVAAGSSARKLSIQRTIDPDYATWRGARQDSHLLIGEFYKNYVQPELDRLQNAPVDPTLKAQMTADVGAMRTEARANPFNVGTAVNALTALVTSTNAVANALSTTVGLVNPAYENRETQARRERTRRTGANTRVGTTKPGHFRGLLSAAEGTTLLDDLHAAVTRGLQGSDLAIDQVGVRGSSVTGTRSRNQLPFEWGTDQYQGMSDASDHDYFFTCTGLDPLIAEHADDRNNINANGTMMGIYLLRFLLRLSGIQTSGRHPVRRFPWAATLRDELIAFTAAAELVTGRKSDVTYISPTGLTGTGLATDPSTVIR
jgi:hypothetical protein